MIVIPLQEFLEDLHKIQKYTFEKDIYEGTDNLGLMEVEVQIALNFIKKYPEGRPFLPDSNEMRAITIGKSSIYIVYSYWENIDTIYLTKIRDYNQKPLNF